MPAFDSNTTTFSDIGLEFPLFQAPIDACSRYRGKGFCIVTGRHNEHCFEVDRVALHCSACDQTLVRTEAAGTCGSCGVQYTAVRMLIASYEAIRGMLATFSWSTELGILRSPPTNALSGRPKDIPASLQTELLCTPHYTTWQGETWLFHR